MGRKAAPHATVTEVREHLQDEPGYTSVLKILQILGEKGHVRHESEGRAYRYYPTVAPEDAGGTALGRIVDKMFRGSAEMALARLVEERRGVRGGVMTLTAWMLYSVAITVLLGGAAWLLELGFAVASRFRGLKPTRPPLRTVILLCHEY